MSGGSLDYAQYKLDEIAEMVAARATTALHRAFAAHLVAVGKALHDLEWVWSCDYGPGDEVEAIRAVVAPSAELDCATAHALAAAAELRELLGSNV